MPRRILIADDHFAVREGVQALLRDTWPSYEYGGVPNQPELMAKLAASHWDLVLLDLTMPGRSGLEIISDVHKLAPDCRIVILTVFEDEEKISRAISAGASGYLVKTSRAETVVEAIIEASQGGSPMSPKVAASVVKMLAKLTKPAAQPVSLSPREHDLLKLLVEDEFVRGGWDVPFLGQVAHEMSHTVKAKHLRLEPVRQHALLEILIIRHCRIKHFRPQLCYGFAGVWAGLDDFFVFTH